MDFVATKSLQQADEKVFEEVFKMHFKALHLYAYTILKDDVMAEEMIENVFYKIWEKKEQLSIQSSLKAYLYKAVYHESLNYLKHQNVKSVHQSYVLHSTNNSGDSADKKVMAAELEENLQKAMNDPATAMPHNISAKPLRRIEV